MNNALTAVQGYVNAIPAAALTNGTRYDNFAQPATTHIGPRARWLLVQADGAGTTHATLESMIAYAAAADGDTATRNGVADKLPIPVAVILSVARLSLVRARNVAVTHLSPVETHTSAALAVHADHRVAVEGALLDYGEAAVRYMAIAYYNAISFAIFNHHHLPTVTGKLSSTTISLTGLQPLFDSTQGSESAIMHDMFHPLTFGVKNEMSREISAKAVLENVQFSNLAKRIPVKATDTAIAMNYIALYNKALEFVPGSTPIPVNLAPPAALQGHIDAYIQSTAATVQAAVTQLQSDALHLTRATAFLGGYLLGKIRRQSAEPDYTWKQAARMLSLLGSPSIKRAADLYSGTADHAIRIGSEVPAPAAVAAHVTTVLNEAARDVALVV